VLFIMKATSSIHRGERSSFGYMPQPTQLTGQQLDTLGSITHSGASCYAETDKLGRSYRTPLPKIWSESASKSPAAVAA
jgi:hypothetical protein